VSTIALVVVTLIGAPEIIRGPITVWFIAICPGMAIARLMGLAQPIVELMLGFALSLALAGLVPSVFLYLGAWSSGWSLLVLVAIALVGLTLDPVLGLRHRRVSMAHPVRGPSVVEVPAPPPIVVAPPSATPPGATAAKTTKRRTTAAGKVVAPTPRTSRRPAQVRPTIADEPSRRRKRKPGPDPGPGPGQGGS
jgi:hypothetical protein